MTEVLRFEEDTLATLPEIDDAPVSAAIWARLESYISRRWGERQAVWTVQGPGDWSPHILPADNFVVSIFDDLTKTWTAVPVVEATPFGLNLPHCAVYKIVATVGDTGDIPAIVQQAYLRLAAYMAEVETTDYPAGASSYEVDLGGAVKETVQRAPTWIARALQHSGAADLLRGYRCA